MSNRGPAGIEMERRLSNRGPAGNEMERRMSNRGPVGTDIERRVSSRNPGGRWDPDGRRRSEADRILSEEVEHAEDQADYAREQATGSFCLIIQHKNP